MPRTTGYLFCPCPDNSVYMNGIECGALFATMRLQNEDICEEFSTENKEHLLVLVDAMGWEVVELKPDHPSNGNFLMHVRKNLAPQPAFSVVCDPKQGTAVVHEE